MLGIAGVLAIIQAGCPDTAGSKASAKAERGKGEGCQDGWSWSLGGCQSGSATAWGSGRGGCWDTGQQAFPPQPQDCFSINRDSLAEACFLSNTVFYKLRSQEEGATAARRLPTPKGTEEQDHRSPTPGWIRGAGRGNLV